MASPPPYTTEQQQQAATVVHLSSAITQHYDISQHSDITTTLGPPAATRQRYTHL